MLAPNVRHPKEVTVRVYKAENLRVAPRSDHKQHKVSQKWKCVILGGKKKISSECVYAPDGNPVWNFEATFKIATRGDPVVLLVSDSEDNHVGQVVVPGVTIPPKPTNPSVSVTDKSRLCIMDMEQTKKTEIGFGRLYFWIWVEEYRSEESKSKSAKGSILSLSSLHLHKDKHSTPNPLNYGGSVLSLSSTNDEYKKKKRWYKKIASHHAVHTPGAIPQSHSPVHSMLNITKPVNNGYNPFDYSQQNLNDDDGVIEEKDGSVLGAYSELTANSLSSSSAFAINQLKRPNSMHSSKRNGSMVSSVDLNMKDSNEQLKTKPELMRIAPKCGPSSGGTEMTIYCRFLTPEMMKQSTVFVDDHPVPQDDWFLFESSQPDLSQLRIHMPSLQPGRYSIYIDSAEFGRIRCNQEFTYLQSNGSVIQSSASNLSVSSMNESTHKIINVSPKVNTSTDESSDHGIVFHRMGSQKSNLVLIDRRSISGGGRHREHSRPEALGRSDSLDDTHQSNDTTSTKSETINDHDPIIDPTTSNRHTNRIINYHMNDSNKELSSSATKQNFIPTGESELNTSLGTPPKIKQSYKQTDSVRRNSQSNMPNRIITSAKLNQNANLMPPRKLSMFSNSQNPSNDETDATDCISTLSGGTSQTMEYSEFTKPHRGSDRSAASGRSKSIMGAGEEEGLKLENEALRSLLNDANHLISTIKSHTLTLETELNAKVNDVDRLSTELCRLKNRLLLDGLTQYLERV